jgi:hypothetical protein
MDAVAVVTRPIKQVKGETTKPKTIPKAPKVKAIHVPVPPSVASSLAAVSVSRKDIPPPSSDSAAGTHPSAVLQSAGADRHVKMKTEGDVHAGDSTAHDRDDSNDEFEEGRDRLICKGYIGKPKSADRPYLAHRENPRDDSDDEPEMGMFVFPPRGGDGRICRGYVADRKSSLYNQSDDESEKGKTDNRPLARSDIANPKNPRDDSDDKSKRPLSNPSSNRRRICRAYIFQNPSDDSDDESEESEGAEQSPSPERCRSYIVTDEERSRLERVSATAAAKPKKPRKPRPPKAVAASPEALSAIKSMSRATLESASR